VSITNLDELKRLREAALSAGSGSGPWIKAASALMDAFPQLYTTAQAMNANAATANGEKRVLVRLLVQADQVLSTLEGESQEEMEALEALRRAIVAATMPHRPGEADLLQIQAGLMQWGGNLCA
jgi:hypothetical protein